MDDRIASIGIDVAVSKIHSIFHARMRHSLQDRAPELSQHLKNELQANKKNPRSKLIDAILEKYKFYSIEENLVELVTGMTRLRLDNIRGALRKIEHLSIKDEKITNVLNGIETPYSVSSIISDTVLNIAKNDDDKLNLSQEFNRTGRRLPTAFGQIIRRMASDAWFYTTSNPAKILEELVVNDVSLSSNTGAVEFTEISGYLSVEPDQGDESAEIYRPLLAATFERIADKNTILRIANSAPELPKWLNAYQAELDAETGPLGENLWLYGHRIHKQLELMAAAPPDPEFPPLSRDLVEVLEEFIVTHNLFVWTFPRVRKLIADLEKSQASLRALTERRVTNHYDLLERLARERGIFDARSQSVLENAAASVPSNANEIESTGLIALVIGLGRGALQGMTKLILGPSKFLTEAAISGSIGTAAAESLKDTRLYAAVTQFFQSCQALLILLAEQLPFYFGWLKPLFNFVAFS